MASTLSDVISIGYKRAVYAALVLTSIAPGTLYLYLQDRSVFETIGTVKTVLFGLAVASPVAVINMAIAFLLTYALFTKERYREGTRLKEEVLNRIILLSTLMATSFSLNVFVVVLYLARFALPSWGKMAALAVDALLVAVFVWLLKRKVDQDRDCHKFGG